jgi:hypothetical protein
LLQVSFYYLVLLKWPVKLNLFRKLQLPVGSLRKLFVWPDKWISIIPRAQLPPSFLQNAYHDLAKHLRKVEVLSLGIVGVNCVSSHYRDTEVFTHDLKHNIIDCFLAISFVSSTSIVETIKRRQFLSAFK